MKKIEFNRFGTTRQGSAQQKTVYGMRMPEGYNHHDAIDWAKDYIDRMYEPDALLAVTQVRALERSDTGYRPKLIESDADGTLSKAEMLVTDFILPDGTPAIKCPFHQRFVMNKVMSEDFESFGNECFDQVPDKESAPADQPKNEGGAAPSKSLTLELDLTYLNDGIDSEDLVLQPGTLIIRCPDQFMPLDLMELIQRYLFFEQTDEPDPKEDEDDSEEY